VTPGRCGLLQVQVEVVKVCPTLTEAEYKPIISECYHRHAPNPTFFAASASTAA
jgi:hypothetical protein